MAMPHPFGLLVRGLTVALAWWCILTGIAIQAGMDDPLGGLGLRWLSWLAGLVFATLAFLILHRREKSRLMKDLQPSSFYGLDVSIGNFPHPISSGMDAVPDTLAEWLVSDFPVERIYHDVLLAIASMLNSVQVQNALIDCRRLRQRLPDFVYEGLTVGNIGIAANATDFILDKSDPLIPILCFSLQLSAARRNQMVLSRHALRQLPFRDQHTLTRTLASLGAGEGIPLGREGAAPHGFSIRDHRSAALLMLFRQLQPRNAPSVMSTASKVGSSLANPIFQRLYDLLHEPGRINGQKQDERLGFLHGDRLYLHWHALLQALNDRLPIEEGRRSTPDVAAQLLAILVEKEMLVTTLGDQRLSADGARFRVVFTGKIGEREHRNEFNDMLILLWRVHFPLMTRMRNSRFCPEVVGQSRLATPSPNPPIDPSIKPAEEAVCMAMAASNTAQVADNAELPQPVSVSPALPSGDRLREHIATKLEAMLQQATKDSPAPVRKGTDPEGRVWLYVSLASIREGLLAGITEAHLRALVMSGISGVICIKNQKQKRIYGFCPDATPMKVPTPDTM